MCDCSGDVLSRFKLTRIAGTDLIATTMAIREQFVQSSSARLRCRHCLSCSKTLTERALWFVLANASWRSLHSHLPRTRTSIPSKDADSGSTLLCRMCSRPDTIFELGTSLVY